MKKVGLKIVGSLFLGVIIGGIVITVIKDKTIDSNKKTIDKFKDYYKMLNQWLFLKNRGYSLEQYFINHNYNSIALYGIGEMGSRLCEELKDSNVEIKYAVDKNNNKFSDLKVILPEDNFEKVDAIVVSATFAFDDIKKELEEKVDYPIISLMDIVMNNNHNTDL